MRHASFLACVAAMCCIAVPLNADESASAVAARQLVAALNEFEWEAIASSDPAHPDTFVAALHIPGSQLLVVRQHHPSAVAVRQRIALSQFRDVYLDLQGSPAAAGKFFVQDSGADGILDAPPGSGGVDVLYEDGVRQTLFNGDPEGQHLARAAYLQKLAAADAEYARLLNLLITAARGGAGRTLGVGTCGAPPAGGHDAPDPPAQGISRFVTCGRSGEVRQNAMQR